MSDITEIADGATNFAGHERAMVPRVPVVLVTGFLGKRQDDACQRAAARAVSSRGLRSWSTNSVK